MGLPLSAPSVAISLRLRWRLHFSDGGEKSQRFFGACAFPPREPCDFLATKSRKRLRFFWRFFVEKKHPHCGLATGTFVRAACLQNETAPKSFNFKTKDGPKNDPKLPRKMLSLVLLCRISHRHYSERFHREFPHKIKYFFTTRICRHGHAKRLRQEIAVICDCEFWRSQVCYRSKLSNHVPLSGAQGSKKATGE